MASAQREFDVADILEGLPEYLHDAMARAVVETPDHPALIEDAKEVLLKLFDADAEYSADTLEGIYDELEKVSKKVLSGDVTDELASEVLGAIARQEDLNGRIRRNVMDTRRAVSFMMRSRMLTAEQFEESRQILRQRDDLRLPLHSRRPEACTLGAVVVQCGPLDHREDVIAIRHRILQTFQYDQRDSIAWYHTFRVGIEGPGVPVGRPDAPFLKIVAPLLRNEDRDPARNREVALVGQQGLAGHHHRDQRGGAGRVHAHRRAAQSAPGRRQAPSRCPPRWRLPMPCPCARG